MRFEAIINGQEIGYALTKLFPIEPGLNGQWFSPQHDGEGFFLTVQDGQMFGAYFTHESDGFPTWYTFDAELADDVWVGTVYLTEGGEMGVPHDPLESEVVGNITLIEGEDPEPEPEPVPENPWPALLSFRHKPYKQPNWFTGQFHQQDREDLPNFNEWFLIWSVPQHAWGSYSSGRNVVYQIEITAKEDLTLTANAHGYGNPAWEGVPNTLSAGEKAVMKCVLTKAGQPQGADDAFYQLNINGMVAVLLTEHITSQT